MTGNEGAGVIREKLWACRRCGTVGQDWQVFLAGNLDRPKTYCLGCIPWWVRFRMRLRGVQ